MTSAASQSSKHRPRYLFLSDVDVYDFGVDVWDFGVDVCDRILNVPKMA